MVFWKHRKMLQYKIMIKKTAGKNIEVTGVMVGVIRWHWYILFIHLLNTNRLLSLEGYNLLIFNFQFFFFFWWKAGEHILFLHLSKQSGIKQRCSLNSRIFLGDKIPVWIKLFCLYQLQFGFDGWMYIK